MCSRIASIVERLYDNGKALIGKFQPTTPYPTMRKYLDITGIPDAIIDYWKEKRRTIGWHSINDTLINNFQAMYHRCQAEKKNTSPYFSKNFVKMCLYGIACVKYNADNQEATDKIFNGIERKSGFLVNLLFNVDKAPKVEKMEHKDMPKKTRDMRGVGVHMKTMAKAIEDMPLTPPGVASKSATAKKETLFGLAVTRECNITPTKKLVPTTVVQDLAALADAANEVSLSRMVGKVMLCRMNNDKDIRPLKIVAVSKNSRCVNVVSHNGEQAWLEIKEIAQFVDEA